MKNGNEKPMKGYEKNMQTLIDWRDTPIEVGSIVVYPGRQGSHQWMVEAEVLEIAQEEQWSTGDVLTVLRVQPLRQGRYSRTNKTPVKLTALERVTVVQSPSKVNA